MRRGILKEYESNEIKWIQLHSERSLNEKEITANQKAIEEFELKKEQEMQEVEKELFDDY